MTQNDSKWRTVRIDATLITPLENLIKNAKDEFGMPLFRNKSDAITKGLKEFLKKHSEDQRSNSVKQIKKLEDFLKELDELGTSVDRRNKREMP